MATVDIRDIYEMLDTMHGRRGWHWWPDGDPFEVIVGCILVQNTMWTNVERALARLREADALTPAAMSALKPDELEILVQPSGQFRQKARKLRAFLALVDARGGLEPLLVIPPPELRVALLATWGIGEETADAIVLYASRQATVVIDAYAQRFFSRQHRRVVRHRQIDGRWILRVVAGHDPQHSARTLENVNRRKHPSLDLGVEFGRIEEIWDRKANTDALHIAIEHRRVVRHRQIDGRWILRVCLLYTSPSPRD